MSKKIKDDNTTRKDQDWLDLCDYVKREILQYSEELKFPKYLALRLRGLLSGKFMANKKQQPMASYTIEQLLLTFKFAKQDILRGLKRTEIEDEQHRINYILVIVESNINDIVLRIRNKKKTTEKIKNINMENMEYEGVLYKDKVKDKKEEEKKKISKKLEDLW